MFHHIEHKLHENILNEIRRVLKPGGQAFIHHSWLYGGSENSFDNSGGRANMSPEQFRGFVEDNKMKIVSQTQIQFM